MSRGSVIHGAELHSVVVRKGGRRKAKIICTLEQMRLLEQVKRSNSLWSSPPAYGWVAPAVISSLTAQTWGAYCLCAVQQFIVYCVEVETGSQSRLPVMSPGEHWDKHSWLHTVRPIMSTKEFANSIQNVLQNQDHCLQFFWLVTGKVQLFMDVVAHPVVLTSFLVHLLLKASQKRVS